MRGSPWISLVPIFAQACCCDAEATAAASQANRATTTCSLNSLNQCSKCSIKSETKVDNKLVEDQPGLVPTNRCNSRGSLIVCDSDVLHPGSYVKDMTHLQLRLRGGARPGGRFKSGQAMKLNKQKQEGNAIDGLPTSVQTTVARNVVAWAAIVGGTLGWSMSQPESEKGVVLTAFVGAVVASTSIQVVSNILRVTVGLAARQQGLAIEKKRNSQQPQGGVLAGLGTFRWTYMAVLAVCAVAEYTYGVNLHRIYEQHAGLALETIGKLHVGANLAGMMTGMFAGGVLDRYGRRNGCMLWALLTGMHCLLIHSKRVLVLVLGRVIAGVSGFLVATSFESWMVTEHHARGYPSHLMAETYRMSSWVTGLATVAAGFVSNEAVKRGGVVASADAAAWVSLISGLLVWRFWTENYGDRNLSASNHTAEAFRRIISDGRLLMMGIVQGLFDGVMWTWAYLWVPTLDAYFEKSNQYAAGTVFSALMMSIIGGTALFKLLTEGLPERFAFSPEGCLALATGVSTAALAAAGFQPSFGKMVMLFLLYEICVGIYTPAMGIMRAKYIDDEMRSSVTGMFRIPTCLVVMLLLMGPVGRSLPITDKIPLSYGIFAGLTGVATLAQLLIIQRERELDAITMSGNEAKSGRKGGGQDMGGTSAAAAGPGGRGRGPRIASSGTGSSR